MFTVQERLAVDGGGLFPFSPTMLEPPRLRGSLQFDFMEEEEKV